LFINRKEFVNLISQTKLIFYYKIIIFAFNHKKTSIQDMNLLKTYLTGIFAIIISTIAISGESVPQDSLNDKDLWKRAEYYVMNNEVEKALDDYLIIYDNDKSNFNAAFRIGYCYLKSENIQDVDAAIDFLNLAHMNVTKRYKNRFSEKKAPVESIFFLGVAYRFQNEYETAIEFYEEYKKVAKYAKLEMVKEEQPDLEIRACKEAMKEKEFVDMRPYHIIIENIEESVNIRCPVYAQDADMLVYTMGTRNIWPSDINYDIEYDDSSLDSIYYSYRKEKDVWTEPINISKQIKVDVPILPISITPDGKKLFFVIDNGDNGDIYMSEFIDDEWTEPQYLKGDVNTSKWESHAAITTNGKRLFFTSNRNGGYGGLDIYYSDYNEEDKKWGKAVNLGPEINSKFNEEMPFITKDGSELYFASEGLHTIGGYDIFYTKYNIDNQKWSTPLNVGYPFNTIGNDMGYIVEVELRDQKNILFCPVNSNKRRIGYDDCECISFTEEWLMREVELNVCVKVDDSYNGLPEDTELIIKNKSTGDEIKTVNLYESDGNYKLMLIPELYELSVASNYFQEQKREVRLRSGDYTNTQIFDISGAIALNTNLKDPNDIDDPDQTDDTDKFKGVEISWVFFDFDLSNIKPEFHEDLNTLSEYLKFNENAKIEVHGHCDPMGSYEYNIGLGQRRADAVKDYLISKGVKASQITTKTFGEERLITNASSGAARKYDRRVEYIITTPENPSLKIVPVEVPQEFLP
jgi:outer membrane protein OmpA-like peptidoglycan-associated protein/tetratricopeptide (TPR) repeat protein